MGLQVQKDQKIKNKNEKIEIPHAVLNGRSYSQNTDQQQSFTLYYYYYYCSYIYLCFYFNLLKRNVEFVFLFGHESEK